MITLKGFLTIKLFKNMSVQSLRQMRTEKVLKKQRSDKIANFVAGNPVASWLVCSTAEQTVWVQAVPGTLCCVLEQVT